jgi:predicted MFS family arabinose efflux permease
MIGITRGELNREVQIILIGTFLTVITYSAMIPYFAVFLKENLALQATAVSTILDGFLGFRRQAVLFGGLLIDRYGCKRLFIIGLILHAISYCGFYFASTFEMFLTFSFPSTIVRRTRYGR